MKSYSIAYLRMHPNSFGCGLCIPPVLFTRIGAEAPVAVDVPRKGGLRSIFDKTFDKTF
jgi:hypothetical protein